MNHFGPQDLVSSTSSSSATTNQNSNNATRVRRMIKRPRNSEVEKPPRHEKPLVNISRDFVNEELEAEDLRKKAWEIRKEVLRTEKRLRIEKIAKMNAINRIRKFDPFYTPYIKMESTLNETIPNLLPPPIDNSSPCHQTASISTIQAFPKISTFDDVGINWNQRTGISTNYQGLLELSSATRDVDFQDVTDVSCQEIQVKEEIDTEDDSAINEFNLDVPLPDF